MLHIYGVYRSRAAWVIWTALELGIEFEHHPIIPAYRLDVFGTSKELPHSNGADFLEINRDGKVPAIIDDDLILNQSLAINLYLVKKNGGPLSPQSLREEAQMQMWTHWVATEVESSAADILHHRVTYPIAKRQPQVAEVAVTALEPKFRYLNDHLADRNWIVADRFTVADLNVAAVVQCAAGAPELFAKFPAIVGWLARCHDRPAYKELIRQRDAQPSWTK